MDNSNKSILILDDDVALRQSFEFYFEDREWTVFSAGSAEEALELLKTETPDCAIVDIRLPKMDGNAFIQLINETHPQLACVICTGSPEYTPPDEILAFPQISKTIFPKPITKLCSIEAEFLELILQVQNM